MMSLIPLTLSSSYSKSNSEIRSCRTVEVDRNLVRFDRNLASQPSWIEQTNENRTVSHSQPYTVTVLSDFLLSDQYEIDIHIDHHNAGTILMIGVMLANVNPPPYNQHLGQQDTPSSWALSAQNGNFFDSEKGSSNFTSTFGTNTLVTIVVNCDLGTLGFKIRNEDKIAITDVRLKGPLRFGVSISNQSKVTVRRIAQLKQLLPAPLIPGLKDGTLWRKKHNYISQMKTPLNILLVGAIGAGKSSFINTLLTAFPEDENDEEISSLCLAFGSTSGHITKSISSFQLKGTTIKLVDSWGWTDTNYDQDEFSALLDGRVDDGFIMGAGVKRGSLGFRSSVGVKDQIHGVIFLLDARETQSKSPNFAKRLQHFINIALNRDYRPVMALTKIDLLDGNLSNNPLPWSESQEVLMAMECASTNCGLATNEIFPCKSYHNEYSRSKNTETMALMALEAAIRRARNFLEKYLTLEKAQNHARNIPGGI